MTLFHDKSVHILQDMKFALQFTTLPSPIICDLNGGGRGRVEDRAREKQLERARESQHNSHIRKKLAIS